MPIGRLPAVGGSQGTLSFPGATAAGVVRLGAAVSLVSIADDVFVVECSATSNTKSFQGFAAKAATAGQAVAIITVRGSRIQPILEGGGDLTVGSALYISDTAGEVTHTPPSAGADVIVYRVGTALSTTLMHMVTDPYVRTPG